MKTLKKAHPSAVDSSYTLFFVASAGIVSYMLATLHEDWGGLFFALFGFALLCYVGRDIVLQVFEPFEAYVTYMWVFLVFPGILVLTISGMYVGSAVMVFVFAHLAAGVSEIIYNRIMHMPESQPLRRLLLGLDNRADTTLINVGNEHFLLKSYRGILFVLLLSALYFFVSFLFFGNDTFYRFYL